MTRIKTDHQLRVEEFMAKANQEVPSKPTLPSEAIRRLRAKIILEEAMETINALGYAVNSKVKGVFELEAMFEPDLVAVVDGCADLSVVTIGTLSACGVADAAILSEVDNNNLAKFGPGSYRREDGKWMKPPDHKKPDFEKILQAQAG